LLLLSLAAFGLVCLLATGQAVTHAWPGGNAGFNGGYSEVTVDAGGRTATVVLHVLDRGGFCDAAAFGAVSLHPALTDAPNDTIFNPATGLPSPRETVDFLIDSGDGTITGASGGTLAPGAHSALGVPTYSTYDNTLASVPIRSFPPLVKGTPDECQAWVTVTGAPGTSVDLLVIVHDDLGDIGFDRVIRFTSGTDLNLTFRWSLVTWPGANGVSMQEALSGTGPAGGGDNVLDQVTAVYSWDPAAGGWKAFFPSGATLPGINDLATLHHGQAYWVAINGPGPVTWRVAGAP